MHDAAVVARGLAGQPAVALEALQHLGDGRRVETEAVDQIGLRAADRGPRAA